jgi:hypothetical protein
MKDIAKSLHTITVLQQVAALHESLSIGRSRADCMADAMKTLGLAGRPDPHGLEEKALRMWAKA